MRRLSAPAWRALFLLACALAICAPTTRAQSGVKPKSAPTPAGAQGALTRTTTRHEVRRFPYGNTLVIYGAPAGAITVEAWPRNEVDITADIELRADTEADLARLAAVNNFVLDEDTTRLTLITTGTHDRKFLKRAARDFPKQLTGLPWKIDYKIRVPTQLDLSIYAGRGAVTVSGVEGALQVEAGEGPATFTLAGGDVQVTALRGSITLRVAARSWRGRGAAFRLAQGDVTVELPAAFNGDLDATVLRTGRLANQHPALAPRERTTPTERALQARAGAGGAPLTIEVGDGSIIIKAATSDK
jgi:hypothetical protein